MCQFYANVNYSTPENCLKLHGDIFVSRDQVNADELECTYHFLNFSVWELSDFREKRLRMKELAESELERRQIFGKAREALLQGDMETALSLFEEAGEIDVFIPELEELSRDIESHIDIEEKDLEGLRKVLTKAYREKFAKKRYERQPERMRTQREKAGVKKIEKLF